MHVEGRVVRQKTRVKHELPSFTIRNLRLQCDRLEGEPLFGKSEAQSVRSRQHLLDGELFIEELEA